MPSWFRDVAFCHSYACVMVPNELQKARGRYLKALLAWHDMNTTDLARILGCSQQSASFKLLGKRGLTADEVFAIAQALDIEPRYLLQVPTYDRGLLTCTKYQVPQVSASALLAA